MIQVTYKDISTTVNKEIQKNKHSHEMTWFRNRIVIWSSLHEPVRIYGSSYGSVFKSPVYRVHNGHKYESPVTEFELHERIRNAATRNRIHELIRTYTCTHSQAYVRLQVYTYILYTYTNIHTLLIHIITQPNIIIYTLKQTPSLIHAGHNILSFTQRTHATHPITKSHSHACTYKTRQVTHSTDIPT